MAVSNVTISQTNIVEGASVLSCHNPLIFLITATYTGTPPAWCRAYVFGFESVIYNCLYLRDESATERTYYLVADEILRNHIGALTNFDQSNETLLFCNSLSSRITLSFEVDGAIAPETLTATMVNAARDFENINGACMVDEYNNESKTYITQKNETVYLYWYNDDADNIIIMLDPSAIRIYQDSDDTLYNMGYRIQEIYPDNISFNAIPTAGKLWCQSDLNAETFEFQTGVFGVNFGTITNVVSDIPYTLTEINTGSWELELNMSVNPSPNDTLSFDYTLNGFTTVSISLSFETPETFTFDIGFIRYALKPISSTAFSNLSINDVVYPHNIIVRNECHGYVLLRYADRNGQYRIMPFSKYYSRTVNPELIGEINQLVLSLKNDSGDTRPVGYRNRDTLKLTAQNLTETEYTLLKDLFNSPDVEAYINGKWLRVKVQGDNIVKLEKRKLKDVTITVELPTSYNITEL